MNLASSLHTLNASPAAAAGRDPRGDLVYDRHVMWLRYLGVARIGVLSFLAVGVALMNLDTGQDVLLGFYLAGFAACIGYLYALQRHARVGATQAWIQLLVDFSVVAVTVSYTQGAASFFTFMFVVVVLEAGLLLGLSQGFVLASMAAVFMSLQLFLPAALLRSSIRFELVYNLLIQSLAFYLAAFISGHWNRRIHRLQEFQREILDNMNSGFLITDARGSVSVLNHAARKILGLRRDIGPGRHVSSVFRVASGGESPVVTALRSGQDFVSYEFEALTGGGESVLLGLTTNTLRDDTGRATGVIASFTDLTEMHAMREELRRHDRLAVVGELAAGLAHEIRNPVAVIRGAVEELGRGPVPPALEVKLRDMAIRESDHLNQIVTDFLDFAREPSRKRQTIDVRALVEEVAELLRREHCDASTMTVKTACPTAPRSVSCDSSQLKQVFMNLGKNAIEAMNDRGTLEISVNEGPGLVEVRFDDEGPGIEPDKVARIYEPFFTTKDTGTGMGLAVCMRIVTAHDGTLRASARQGGGCSMRVSLPAAGQS